MAELMLGNKAFARGLYEGGCSVVSSYPGTPSTEVTEEAAKYEEIYCEWAPNEKVALEVAFGACLAGKRSFCGMKHVGLNVAALLSVWRMMRGCTRPRMSRTHAITRQHRKFRCLSHLTRRKPASLPKKHLNCPRNLIPRLL